MPLITVVKEELDEMAALIKKQDAIIKDQTRSLETMSSEIVVMSGIVIYTSRILYQVAAQQGKVAESLNLPLTPQMTQAAENLKTIDKVWGGFLLEHPAESVTLSKRIGLDLHDLQKGVSQ